MTFIGRWDWDSIRYSFAVNVPVVAIVEGKQKYKELASMSKDVKSFVASLLLYDSMKSSVTSTFLHNCPSLRCC